MKTSIITVNFNNTTVTKELLLSIELLRIRDLEVIVVDNGSDEDPTRHLESSFPWAKVIRSEKNLGFAGGNNLGIQYATGDFLFFINNDTVLEEDIISPLMGTLLSDESIGMICPLIHTYGNPFEIQFAGFSELHPITGRNKCYHHPLSETRMYETAFPHGAAMMISRRVLEEVGPMQEDYFLYYEELDWAQRIKNAGYRVMVEPSYSILHKESMSVKKISNLKLYYMTRNRILYMRRFSTKTRFAAFMSFFLLVSLPKKLLALVKEGNYAGITTVFNAIKWNFNKEKADSVEKDPLMIARSPKALAS